MSTTFLVMVVSVAALLAAPLSAVADDSAKGLGFQMVPQLGHTQTVRDLFFTAGDRLIVSGGKDGKIKLWSPDGRLLRTLNSYSPMPRTAVSRDGTMIAAAGHGVVELWSTMGERLAQFPRIDSRNVGPLAMAPDDSYLLACSGLAKRDYCQAFDPSGRELFTIENPNPKAAVLREVVISPDGESIFGFAHRTVFKWNRRGELMKQFEASAGEILAIAMSPNGSRIATLGNDLDFKDWRPKVRKTYSTAVWDLDGNLKKRFPSHESRSLHFSHDGERLISGGLSDNRVLFHSLDGRLLREIKIGRNKADSPIRIALSSDDTRMVVADDHFSPARLQLWTTEGELLHRTSGITSSLWNLAVDRNSGVIVTTSLDSFVRFWLPTGQLVKRYHSGYDAPELLAISPTGNTFVTGGTKVTLWGGDGKEIATEQVHKVAGRAAAYSPKGDLLVTVGADGYVNLIPFAKDKATKRFKAHDGQSVESVAFHPGGDIFATGSIWDRLRIWDREGNLLGSYAPPKDAPPPFGTLIDLTFTPDGKYIIGASTRPGHEISVHDLSGRLITTIKTGNTHNMGGVAISDDGKYLARTVGRYIGLWELPSFKLLGHLQGHLDNVYAVEFLPGGHQLVSGGSDGLLKIWNLDKGDHFFMMSQGNEWAMFTNDGYFDGSRRAGEMISLVRGLEAYSIDQLALIYNRPDIVYERMGIGSESYVQHFRAQYKDRLRRAQVREVGNFVNAPTVRIADTRREGKTLHVDFEAGDSSVELTKTQVYVNDVPLYPEGGRPIEGREVRISEQVELTEGKNKIEVSVFNELGIESIRAVTFAEHRAKTKGDLYFVGIGVSRYQEPALNLRYAHKDVLDLAALFKRYEGKAFGKVHTLTLVDEAGTRGSLAEADAFARRAGVDDMVVLFITGHGGYDTASTARYYFLPHDVVPGKLAESAIPFDDLESLMANTRARRKLMLMDTCASGEMDPQVLEAIRNKAAQSGLQVRASDQLRRAEKEAGRPYLFFRNRFIYNDLNRRSGAIVFSSSLGEEASLESPKLENGVFTEAVLRALTTKATDANKDGRISMDELETAVKAAVVHATGNLQHPTIDRENIYQTISLPLIQ